MKVIAKLRNMIRNLNSVQTMLREGNAKLWSKISFAEHTFVTSWYLKQN